MGREWSCVDCHGQVHSEIMLKDWWFHCCFYSIALPTELRKRQMVVASADFTNFRETCKGWLDVRILGIFLSATLNLQVPLGAILCGGLFNLAIGRWCWSNQYFFTQFNKMLNPSGLDSFPKGLIRSRALRETQSPRALLLWPFSPGCGPTTDGTISTLSRRRSRTRAGICLSPSQ